MKSLVTTSWLAQHLADDDLVVIDASAYLPGAGRDAAAEFAAAHIPRARFLDLGTLTDPPSLVPKALPTPEQFARRMREIGVVPGERIVFYDDSKLRSSARAWFIARLMGAHRVAILDGGLQKWRADGLDLESGQSGAASSAYPVPDAASGKVRSKAQMLANYRADANQPGEQVVDARDAARFCGEVDDTVHGLPGGHIPGARNVFFRDLLNSDGTFKSHDELNAAFIDAGIDLDRPVTASCGSGMTASVLLFALHLLGRDDTALYDGSWAEWGADPATPKATGAPA